MQSFSCGLPQKLTALSVTVMYILKSFQTTYHMQTELHAYRCVYLNVFNLNSNAVDLKRCHRMGLKIAFQLIQAPLTPTFTVQFTGRGNETLICSKMQSVFIFFLFNE